MVADQILGHQARGKEKPFDGFIFEVKDNFCDEVRGILARHMRTHGYTSLLKDTNHISSSKPTIQSQSGEAFGAGSRYNGPAKSTESEKDAHHGETFRSGWHCCA